MIVRTRIFELCHKNYKNLSELAGAMGISISQVYRVREGKRSINQKFIVGAIKAFPRHKLDDLFYLAPEPAAEPRMERIQQTLKRFDLAVEEYAEHFRSHTSAAVSLIEASQELRKGARVGNKILGYLIRSSVS